MKFWLFCAKCIRIVSNDKNVLLAIMRILKISREFNFRNGLATNHFMLSNLFVRLMVYVNFFHLKLDVRILYILSLMGRAEYHS